MSNVIYKNRSHYSQQQNNAEKTVPTHWEEKITNRKIDWKLGMDGLSYVVTGERINHGELIVRAEHRTVTIYTGAKKSVWGPDVDVLQALADAYAAEIFLGDGEAYRGVNGAGETPDTPQVFSGKMGLEYPYTQ